MGLGIEATADELDTLTGILDMSTVFDVEPLKA